MIRIAVFELLQVLVSGYALRWGGAPERIVGGLLLAAAWTSLLLPYDPKSVFRNLETGQLIVDLSLLAGLLAVALRANRFWPLWAAAIQLLAIGVHGVRSYDEGIVPIVYARLTGELAYPMCLVLAAGTWRYRRRLSHGAAGVRDWTPYAKLI